MSLHFIDEQREKYKVLGEFTSPLGEANDRHQSFTSLLSSQILQL